MSFSGENFAEADLVFHIAENQDWEKPGDHYRPLAYLAEGFVHLSTKSQVLATAQRYYAGRSGLTLIAVQVSALPESLVYENLLGGDQLFPHYYAEIPRATVVATAPLLINSEGEFTCALLDA